MAIEIGMYIGRILLNPSVHDAKVALRIGSENLVYRQEFFWCGGLFNQLGFVAHAVSSSGFRRSPREPCQGRIVEMLSQTRDSRPSPSS
jgi:hypothetical protein